MGTEVAAHPGPVLDAHRWLEDMGLPYSYCLAQGLVLNEWKKKNKCVGVKVRRCLRSVDSSGSLIKMSVDGWGCCGRVGHNMVEVIEGQLLRPGSCLETCPPQQSPLTAPAECEMARPSFTGFHSVP